MKECLGRRYSKQEMNLGIAFLNEGIPTLLIVNSLLISLTIQRFRMSDEIQILLAPDKERKSVFPEVPIVRFKDSKSLQDYLVRAALANMGNTGGSELCGNDTCQVCDHIITTNTFPIKAYREVSKIQSGPFNCNS